MNQDTEIGKQHLGVNGSRVRVDVSGRPRTKGSMAPKHIKVAPGICKVALTESGKYSAPWKRAMIAAVRAACVVERYPGAVVIDCFFRFDRLCAPDSSLDWPTREGGEYGHGDEDKLRRNVLDALVQAGLILDDSLSAGGLTWKRWARPEAGEGCGVLIKVRPVGVHELEMILAMERMP